MVAKNDHTGDELRTKPQNKKYSEGWDRIFGKNKIEFWAHICEIDGVYVNIERDKPCNCCGQYEDGSFD